MKSFIAAGTTFASLLLAGLLFFTTPAGEEPSSGSVATIVVLMLVTFVLLVWDSFSFKRSLRRPYSDARKVRW